MDSDFFDLLQRLRTSASSKDVHHIDFVIQQGLSNAGERLWQSFERLFYTAWYRARLRQWLFNTDDSATAEDVEEHFARSIQALLRAAHATNVCAVHSQLFKLLRGRDTVISFNYDLVPERSLAGRFRGKPYGTWLYGLEKDRPIGAEGIPKLLKLHGSVNWKSGQGTGIDTPEKKSQKMGLRQTSWDDFLEGSPGYQARATELLPSETDLPRFPIMLPFWEKRVDHFPWKSPWEEAARRLCGTESLLVWGYSLPPTDLKVRELFAMSLSRKAVGGASALSEGVKHLCIIDPNDEAVNRWRSLFLQAQFWRYRSIADLNLDKLPWCS